MGYIYKNAMYFFQYEESYYAYSFSKHVIITIDSTLYYWILEQEKSDKFNHVVDMWRRIGLLDIIETEERYLPRIKQVQFSFSTIHNCNLNCKYCFADHGERFCGVEREISRETVDKILKYVYFEQYDFCKEYRIDFLSGGEPLLNFDIIQYTIEKSKKLLAGTDKKLTVFLVTNGTIYDPTIFNYLDKCNVNIGISIDGDKEVHNRNRHYKDGTGSYEKVINTIKQIQNTDVLSNRIKDIWGLSVITGESSNMSDIIMHHRNIGINNLQMEMVRASKMAACSINNNNVDKLIQEYKNLADFFLGEIKEGSFCSLKSILNEHDYFGKIICRVIHGGRIYYRCMAGIGKINFDATGNIYPCEMFAGNPRFCMGNVNEGINFNKVAMFYGGHVDSRPKCKECWARYLCGGDCYANSNMVNEDMLIPDETFCKLNKKIVEYALVIMITLKQKGLLKECESFIRMRKVLTNAAGGSIYDDKENK